LPSPAPIRRVSPIIAAAALLFLSLPMVRECATKHVGLAFDAY
jgi:hypothetical protein